MLRSTGRRARRRAPDAPKPLERQEQAVPHAPDDELPARAVPQAAQQEHDPEIARVGQSRRGCRRAGCRRSRGTRSTAIMCQRRQNSVIDWRDVRVVEVLREAEAEHARQCRSPCRNSRRSRSRSAGCSRRCRARRAERQVGRRQREHVVGDRRHVGDQHLLRQADDEARDARRRNRRPSWSRCVSCVARCRGSGRSARR